MNFQHIETFHRIGKQVLAEYQIADTHRLELLHRSENITFLIVHKDSRTKFGVLRISRPGYHTMEELNAELSWLYRIVLDTNLVVARPVKNQNGQPLTQVDLDGIVYNCILFEYLEGMAPNPCEGERSLFEFAQVGEIAATLHRHAITWKEGKTIARPVWDYEGLLGRKGLFGDWRLCNELSDDYELMERTCEKIRERLLAYGMREDNFGLIHSDLRAANLLVEDGQMKVLDFDDSGYGWYLYDLAASISFLEDHPLASQWVEAWIRGYEKILPLKERDKNEIQTFIMTRRIQLLAWITSHDDSDPVKLFYQGFAGGTVRMATRYVSGESVFRYV